MAYVFDEEIELPFLDDAHRPDPRFDGLEVVASEVPISLFIEVARLTGEGGLQPLPENEEAIARVFEVVVASLVRWNLTDKAGNEVPCTPEGFASRPKRLQEAVVNAWMRGQLEIAPDFGDGSVAGSPTVPIPMEPLAS